MKEYKSVYSSEKQQALVKYWANRLGFESNSFLEIYLNNLLSSADGHRSYRAIESEEEIKLKRFSEVEGSKFNKEGEEVVVRIFKCKDSEYYDYDGKRYIPHRYTLVDFMIDEYDMKKNNKIKPKTFDFEQNMISATDLSTFVFCPVSYVISKSFEVESILSAERGTELHEQNRLGSRFTERDEKGDFTPDIKSIINDRNKELFEDIANSELIYSGHSTNSEKYFVNSKGNFVGQPDYVFKKKDGQIFIVEEKFKKWSNDLVFFVNHKVQLYSYIYGLDEFKAEYGYLVQWQYDFQTGITCDTLKLEKMDNVRTGLNQIFKNILDLRTSKNVKFDTQKLNPNKCGNCAVKRYCGHKTGKFDDLEFPYSEKYLQTYKTPYPEILIKQEGEAFVGDWTVTMKCTYSDSPLVRIEDIITETWRIKYKNDKIIVSVPNGDTDIIEYEYEGHYLGNTLLLKTTLNDGELIGRMTVDVSMKNSKEMYGCSEVLYEFNDSISICKVKYSTECKKSKFHK